MNKSKLFILIFTTFIMAGASAMSFFSNNTAFNWEWAAGRIVKHKVIIEVVELEAVSKWIKSPSFAADMPDPVSLEGRVLRSDFPEKINIIKFVLPKPELGDVSKGEKLALGLIDDNTVVCIGTLPLNLSDTEEAVWLAQWECKKL